MKRMGNVLVAVAVMVGALGATGCKKDSDQAAQQDGAPVVAQASVQGDAPANGGDATVQASIDRLPAPPALRAEEEGAAPSAHHVWQRGFWRWDTAATNYVWAPGYWEDTTANAPYAPPAARYEYVGYAPGDGYLFVPGYWRWGGSEYAWVYGHWSLRNDAGYYWHSRWGYDNGRWYNHFDRWDGDRWARWDRDNRGHYGYGWGRGDHGDRDHGGRFGDGRGDGHGDGHFGQGHGDGHFGQGHGDGHGDGHYGQGHGDGHHGQGQGSQAQGSHHPAQPTVNEGHVPSGHASAGPAPVHATARPNVIRAATTATPQRVSGSTQHRVIGHTGSGPIHRGHG